MPVSRSQDARVVSAEAEKMVLLERDQERSRMAPLCPVRMPWLGQVPFVCQRRMVRSMLPEARWGVVGENRAQKTSAVWPKGALLVIIAQRRIIDWTHQPAPLWALGVHLYVAPRLTDRSAGLLVVVVQHTSFGMDAVVGRATYSLYESP